MSIKTERLGNVLHREISQILINEIKDQDLKFVTITKVDLSSLDNDKKDKVLKDINNASRFIRSELMRRKIEIRNMPELTFVYDDSIEYGNKIESIIEKIHEEK